ncbi:SDR family oxidoreductase [Rhizobium alvei]|uniref:SDR family oxidoreductase n=1 Tax=Rhizobium alvei TaxID=1132659 RepID=A0ABT8YQP5_9HYPH|nr:SDR family oxidoreductase [Rhizobium alvei]MDO6966042.1 SDR family oxidoreductase [Rhizobium alvei]
MSNRTMPNIFITGAASGIGAATARLFAARGWRVGLADRDVETLERLGHDLGSNAMVLPLDVLDPATVESALATFVGPENKLAALFNSAGLLDMRPFAETPLERLHAILDVNIKGVVNSIAAATPYLKAHGHAAIVTMSSAAAIYGVPDLAVYSASKFAIRGLTEALNIEFEKAGVRVSDVMVGYVDTPILSKAETTAKSVALSGVNVTADKVAETVWRAVSGQQVHWFVREEDRAAADHFDATPRELRHELIRPATGY